MVINLFAACRVDGELVCKRVRLNEMVQRDLAELFNAQEESFRKDVVHEIPFYGTWKPDDDELLIIDLPQEAEVLVETVHATATSIEDIDATEFAKEGIRAIFTGAATDSGKTKVLVQRFTAHQLLERKFSLVLTNNAFRRISEPAFTLDTSLTCIIEDDRIKFKSQQRLRSIINLTEVYRAATDQEVRAFANHDRLDVSDVDAFVTDTDQTTRKLISMILRDGTLDHYDTTMIKGAAQSTGLMVHVRRDRIMLPSKRMEVKDLLQFLTESRYAGPLSGKPYVTNSRRPA